MKLAVHLRSRALAAAVTAVALAWSPAAWATANPPEMAGEWCYQDLFSAITGPGHSYSRICFTLIADGRYTYYDERSMSAYGGRNAVWVDGNNTDGGRWAVNGGVLTAQSPRTGTHRFRLGKANHPKTGEAMLCLNEDCFVTQVQRRLW